MCFLGCPRGEREGVRPLFGEPPIWAPGWAVSGLSGDGDWEVSGGGIVVLSERARGARNGGAQGAQGGPIGSAGGGSNLRESRPQGAYSLRLGPYIHS